MRIEKRISFSLDEVWAECCFSPTRSKAYQHELYGWLISLGCNGGTPFYLIS
jgi:hypothetical protein